MKKGIILILLLYQCFLAFGYELGKKVSFGGSLSYFKIYEDSKEIAQIYFLDPSSKYHFFSIESTPTVFNHLSSGIDTLAMSKNINPSYAILADFSKPIKIDGKISFGYIWHSIGVLVFAPEYLKKVRILNPNNISQRFFMETEINGKEFYSVIIFNKATDIDLVKKIVSETKGLNLQKFKLYSLLNFPMALMTFGKKDTIIYESHKNIKKYSCLFLTGK
jgi:hypothetical protein